MTRKRTSTGTPIIRGLVLVFFGMVYNGLLEIQFATQRYPSVLGRIGLAYMFAALIMLNTNVRGRVLWIIGLLVGYWAALQVHPRPGLRRRRPRAWPHADRLHRSAADPGQTLHEGDRDPEGLFATIPAIATAWPACSRAGC